MPIISVTRDLDAPSITVVAEYPVSAERLWEAYTDARQIERFWGPPEFPAVFTRHEPVVGGASAYEMTGPEGEKSCGFWKWIDVDPGRSFTVEDGFANDDGTPNTELPSMRMVYTFESMESGSRLITATEFASREELEQLLEMGMEEGMSAAMAQIDAVLAELPSTD